MERRSRLLRFVVGPVLILILIPAFLTALPYGRTLGRTCGACAGEGWVVPPGAVCASCQGSRCRACDGSGGRFSIVDFAKRYQRKVETGRSAVLEVLSRNTRLCLSLAGCVVVGMMWWWLRETACPVCVRTGRLQLEVIPPDATAFVVRVGCPFCGCTGTVAAIDRPR